MHEDSCSSVSRTESGVLEHLDSIRILDGGNLESRRILGDHIIVTTLREVHMESMWTPEGLHGEFQEFIWTPDGVHQDAWLSVTNSPNGRHALRLRNKIMI